MLDLEKARKELSEKNLMKIHEQTAWTWASRAAASFEISMTKSNEEIAVAYSEAEEYKGEALEHAAQVGFDLVRQIEEALSPFKFNAIIRLTSEEFRRKNV